jgi:hypothetical protein
MPPQKQYTGHKLRDPIREYTRKNGNNLQILRSGSKVKTHQPLAPTIQSRFLRDP